jgi:hypothetical protein
MALIMVFCGLAMAGVGIGGYGVRVVRDAESILPDHQVIVGPSADSRDKLQDLLSKRQALITQSSSPERDQALKDISQELRDLGRR